MIPPERIARRFGAAAETYAEAAHIQRRVADALADAVLAAGPATGGRVAEFGCGVGFLTERLAPALAPALWLASDLAPQMTAALERRLSLPGLRTAVIDAAQPDLEPGFDLVCSSLTLQWLPDPGRAIAAWRRLVRPGGLLAFSTLLDGTFAQWRGALEAAGADWPGPRLQTAADLAKRLSPTAMVQIFEQVDRHSTALSFLRAARLTGVDAGMGETLRAGAMRRAMRALDAGGARVTYRAAIVVEMV